MRPCPAFQPFLITVVFALAACQQPREAARTAHAPPTLETADPGVPVLAAVQNARASIAAGDRLAAYNSVAVALSNAVQLTGSSSALFPPEAAPPGYRPPAGGGGYGGRGGGRGGGHGRGGGGGRRSGGGGGPPAAQGPPTPPSAPAPTNTAATPAGASTATPPHARRGGRAGVAASGQGDVTAFDAQVRLTSIQAKLQTGDVAGADADLGALEASAARHPAPMDLPLVRADQSLALASAAADGGRLGELQTQLQAARASLEAYRGQPHAADARALAAAIGQALSDPAGLNALPPIELSLWSGRLSSWV
jgi:hypothetical protein